jgi:hypothetical protein
MGSLPRRGAGRLLAVLLTRRTRSVQASAWPSNAPNLPAASGMRLLSAREREPARRQRRPPGDGGAAQLTCKVVRLSPGHDAWIGQTEPGRQTHAYVTFLDQATPRARMCRAPAVQRSQRPPVRGGLCDTPDDKHGLPIGSQRQLAVARRRHWVTPNPTARFTRRATDDRLRRFLRTEERRSLR